MPTCYKTFLDLFLTSVPVSQLDEADSFVREVQLMCTEFMDQSPVLLYKSLPPDARYGNFFTVKNRHRTPNPSGILFNEAVQMVKAFESGLDVNVTADIEHNCVVILPDSFKLTFSNTSLEQFTESAAYVDPAELGALTFRADIGELTEKAQHIVATSVPFYYCIRIN